MALGLLLSLTACGGAHASGTELHVFAAASLTETMDQIIALYRSEAPDVAVIPTYDSSGTLLAQIQEGADCDLFLSAAPKQMNALEESNALMENTRLNLLENRVVLAVRETIPDIPEDVRNIPDSFDSLADRLKSGEIMAAVGNSDVPVGQYTEKIFEYYGIDPAGTAAGRLSYGSNVKEVTTQIAEGAADCGIIYATDAFSAGLTVVDSATAEMCGQVIYPAAVPAESRHPDEAKAFLAFLSSDGASAVFESAGFTPLR